MTLRMLCLSTLAFLPMLSCSAISGETEIPDYSVEQADNAFEIRRYDPQILSLIHI